MAELIREPIGLRVLVRALRPDDREPFRLWRADPQAEIDALLELGEDEERAALWASLLRWREAQAVAAQLTGEGWEIALQGVRAIALARAVEGLRPPSRDEGWLLQVGDLTLRAVPEAPIEDEGALARMLTFLDAGQQA